MADDRLTGLVVHHARILCYARIDSSANKKGRYVGKLADLFGGEADAMEIPWATTAA